MTNRTAQFKKIIEGYNKKLFRDGLTEADNIKLSFAEARLQERQHGLGEELKSWEEFRKRLKNDDADYYIFKRIKEIKSELKENADN